MPGPLAGAGGGEVGAVVGEAVVGGAVGEVAEGLVVVGPAPTVTDVPIPLAWGLGTAAHALARTPIDTITSTSLRPAMSDVSVATKSGFRADLRTLRVLRLGGAGVGGGGPEACWR